jgi:hypothetical protein
MEIMEEEEEELEEAEEKEAIVGGMQNNAGAVNARRKKMDGSKSADASL